jgi:transglutaminase-like putative cysteine protease
VRVLATIPLRTNRELELAVELLARLGLEQMQRHQFPPMYGGAVRYQREPAGVEIWQPAIDVYGTGNGDCEDLAALQLAWLWKQGIQARADVLSVNPYLKHVRVRLPDGTLLDPSAKLGMKGGG